MDLEEVLYSPSAYNLSGPIKRNGRKITYLPKTKCENNKFISRKIIGAKEISSLQLKHCR
jgi:hypothetical protein